MLRESKTSSTSSPGSFVLPIILPLGTRSKNNSGSDTDVLSTFTQTNDQQKNTQRNFVPRVLSAPSKIIGKPQDPRDKCISKNWVYVNEVTLISLVMYINS